MPSRSPGGSLSVWLYGVHVANLSEPSRFRLRLAFTDDALDTFGEGSRVLSLALPISHEPVVDGKKTSSGLPVSAFIEGLLPEGNLRAHIAAEARVPVTDSMQLLRRVGAECAGAVQILEDGIAPGPGYVRRLTNEEVASWGMSARRARAIVMSCMENVHDVVDSVPLPPGAEPVRANLEAMWIRRAWQARG